MKKAALLLAALLALLGCDDEPTIVHYTVRGTVRNVWCANQSECNVVFEHDQGGLQSIPFNNVPPIWTGMHCQITFHFNNSFNHYGNQIDNVERIP